MTTFQKTVKVEVSKAGVSSAKDRLAAAYLELLEIKQEKASSNQDLNKRLKDARKEMRELVALISTGQREETVECEERFNGKRKVMETVRVDTGAVLDSRPPTAEEANLGLFDRPEKSNGQGKPKRGRRDVGEDEEAGVEA